MKAWIIENIAWIMATVVIPVVGWFSSKKFYQEKTLESQGLENVQKSVLIYRDMISDLERQLDKQEQYYEKEIQKLQHRLNEVEKKRQSEKAYFKKQIEELKKMVK